MHGFLGFKGSKMAAKDGGIRQGHSSGNSSQGSRGFVARMSPDDKVMEYANHSCRDHGSSDLAGWFRSLVFPTCGM